MAKVTIYTIELCPYCHQAKRLLAQKAVEFEEVDVTGNGALRRDLEVRTGGRSSLPQIWVGDTHVGGCDDLHALERSGDLDRLIHA